MRVRFQTVEEWEGVLLVVGGTWAQKHVSAQMYRDWQIVRVTSMDEMEDTGIGGEAGLDF